MTGLLDPLRRLIADRVPRGFNDRAAGEALVARRSDGRFGQTSISWKVHGDVVAMMAGGISALLLKMFRPSVLTGVWDHSNSRADLHGRLRRTARFMALTTMADVTRRWLRL